MTRPSEETATLLDAMAQMKRQWLHDHSEGKSARPAWVIDLGRRDLSVLVQAASDYRDGRVGA